MVVSAAAAAMANGSRVVSPLDVSSRTESGGM